MHILPLVLVLVDPRVSACHEDDAEACYELGVQAELSQDPAERSQARERFAKACQLGLARACDTDLVSSRAAPPPEGPPTHERSEPALPDSVSRWGAVGVLGFTHHDHHLGGIVGGGVRYGLRERSDATAMFMPAVALVAGAMVFGDAYAGWAEARFELMGAGGTVPLQPSYVGYLIGGVSLRASSLGVRPRPYLGLGTGWNWSPPLHGLLQGASGSPVTLVGVAVVLAVMAPAILAGRVELRYLPALQPDESDEASGVIGFGF